MLSLLFVFAYSDCTVANHSNLVDTLVDVIGDVRNFAQYAGKPTNTTVPHVWEGEDYWPYVYGIAGLAAPFLICTVLLIPYFLLGQIFACCPCCHAVNSRSITGRAAGVFLGLVVLMCASAGLFFFAANSISSSLTQIALVPDNLLSSTKTIVNVVESTVDEAFELINTTLDGAVDELNSFLYFAGNGSTTVTNASNQIITLLNAFKAPFYHPTVDTTFQQKAKNFDTDYAAASCGTPASFDVYNFATTLGTKIQEMVDSANAMISAFSNIDEIVDQVRNATDKQLVDVRKMVNNYSVDVNEMINPYRNISNNISEILDPIDKILGLVNTNTKTGIYSVVSFMLAVSLIYLLFFFCNNCLARCVVSWFWTCGFILTIIIVIPSAIFSVIFYLFYDVCPMLEPTMDSFAKEQFGTYLGETNLSQILTCSSEEKNIYKLLNVSDSMNYTKIVDDLRDDVQDFITAINVPSTLEGLINNALELNMTEQLDFKYLFNNNDGIVGIKSAISSSTCPAVVTVKDTLIGYLDDMQSIITSSGSEFANIAVEGDKIIDFAQQVLPKVNDTKNALANVIDEFLDKAVDIVDQKLEILNCSLLCEVYVPVRNALCAHLVDGMAFWLSSAACTVIGITFMSVSLCQRRRSMLPAQVEDVNDYDYDYDDYDEPYDRYRRSQPRRSRASRRPARRHRKH